MKNQMGTITLRLQSPLDGAAKLLAFMYPKNLAPSATLVATQLLLLITNTNLFSQNERINRPEEAAIPTSYNFKIGKRTFLSAGAGIEFSFNDNITLAKNNKKSDLTIAPAFQLGFIHSFNKQFRIRSAFDFSYIKHLNYTELDHFSITPNGGNDFEISLRAFDNWIFRASATFSLSRSTVLRNTQLGFGGVTVFNNSARLSADADYNNLVVGMSYTSNLNLSLDRKYGYLDLLTHTGEFNLGFRVNRPILVGIKGSLGYLDNIRNKMNDAVSFSGQLYGNFVLTRTLTATSSVGYQVALFNDNKGQYEDDSDYGNVIFSFGLNHELSRKAVHSITLSRSMQPAVRSNYQDTLSLSYNLSYIYSRYLSLDFLFDWLTYDESSNPKDVPDKSDIFSVTVGTGFSLTRQTSLVAKYQYRWSLSDKGTDYQNNILTLAINYRF